MEKIQPKVLEIAKDAKGGSFKVDARRSDKSFPLKSQEIAAQLGPMSRTRTGMRVDLTRPDVVLHVDVTRSGTVLYSGKQAGPGAFRSGPQAA